MLMTLEKISNQSKKVQLSASNDVVEVGGARKIYNTKNSQKKRKNSPKKSKNIGENPKIPTNLEGSRKNPHQ